MARNVKNRQNSKVTVKNLEKIQNELKLLKDEDLTMGLFVFAGVDIYDTNIFCMIKPNSQCNKFSYKCMNKFIVDDLYDHLKIYNGSIIFVSGDTYFIYKHGENGFEQFKYKSVDLGNRHRKGGQSQHRHERNFDIIKDFYVSTIVEITSKLTTENNWIFGSLDIIDKIILKDPKLHNGGFIEFDRHTINDTKKWLSYLKDDTKLIKKEEMMLENILTLIQIDPDRLEFDMSKDKDYIEYYMINDDEGDESLSTSCTPLDKMITLKRRHKQYEHLYKYQYIGVKYKGYNNDDEDYT